MFVRLTKMDEQYEHNSDITEVNKEDKKYMFGPITEKEIKTLLKNTPKSELVFCDDPFEGSYDFTKEKPILGIIYDTSPNKRFFTLYFKNGGGIRHYGTICSYKSEEKNIKTSSIYFMEGDYEDEYISEDDTDYDLQSIHNIVKQRNKENVETRETINKYLISILNGYYERNNSPENICFLYGYLWMNAKIFGIIDETISFDKEDPKNTMVSNVEDEQLIKEMKRRCNELYLQLVEHIKSLN